MPKGRLAEIVQETKKEMGLEDVDINPRVVLSSQKRGATKAVDIDDTKYGTVMQAITKYGGERENFNGRKIPKGRIAEETKKEMGLEEKANIGADKTSEDTPRTKYLSLLAAINTKYSTVKARVALLAAISTKYSTVKARLAKGKTFPHGALDLLIEETKREMDLEDMEVTQDALYDHIRNQPKANNIIEETSVELIQAMACIISGIRGIRPTEAKADANRIVAETQAKTPY